jgi:hypothetical protein
MVLKETLAATNSACTGFNVQLVHQSVCDFAMNVTRCDRHCFVRDPKELLAIVVARIF